MTAQSVLRVASIVAISGQDCGQDCGQFTTVVAFGFPTSITVENFLLTPDDQFLGKTIFGS
jgi:hypothetical protein